MNLIKKVIKCSRTVELIHKALKGGFPPTTKIHLSLVASVAKSLNSVSSLLCEILLNEFDIYIAKLESGLNCGCATGPCKVGLASHGSNIELLYVRYSYEFLLFL